MQRPRTKIVDVLKLEPPRSQLRVKGWLRTVRDSKQVVFLELNDGSCFASLQAVCPAALPEFEQVRKLTTGSAVEVVGELVASPAAGQKVELQVSEVIVVGLADSSRHLFDEQPAALLHVGPFEQRSGAPQVSVPERALLELLSEVGVRQPLQEARELTESAYNLRADVLRELLQRCTNIKTVRLCLQLGKESSQPWAAKLDAATLPTGSRRPWVSKSADGLLVLKP